MSKIILLNGPKACGKNVAVEEIKNRRFVIDRRVKDHLFVLTASLFRLTMEEFFSVYENRETKETPQEMFSISGYAFNRLAHIIGAKTIQTQCMVKLSVREALIFVSEVVCKPTYGRAYFGEARADAITDHEFAIDDSCGFDAEIQPTIDKLGQENILLIRVLGRGTFEGDSRSFISNGIVHNTIDVWNAGTEENFVNRMARIATDFYDGV